MGAGQKREDRYADCRFKTGFVFDRPIWYATGDRKWSSGESRLRYDWVLHLDSDEYVSHTLAHEMRIIARKGGAEDEIVAYEVPFRMFFMGRWLRYGGTFPNCQVRFRSKKMHCALFGWDTASARC